MTLICKHNQVGLWKYKNSPPTYTNITEDSSTQQEHNPGLPLHDIRRGPVHPRHENTKVREEGHEWTHGLAKGSHLAGFVFVRPEIEYL